MTEPDLQQPSVIKPPALPGKRNVAKVPFVELHGGRLQGVVSSGSDIERVYVSCFESGSQNFSCSTNNNRPCGGLGSRPCNHLRALLDEALLQYGAARVVPYLGMTLDPAAVESSAALLTQLRGGPQRLEAGVVFSRFLTYLHHVQLPATTAPVPEMSWFVR
jgi:hypothetical protein